MKTFLALLALLMAGIIFAHRALQEGTILRYIDEHPHDRGIPKATYYIGEGYYIFSALPEATTYFLRAAQRYPDLALGDDAYFAYLQCMDDSSSVTRNDLVEGYKAYVEKYPKGRHIDTAKNRIDVYTTGAR